MIIVIESIVLCALFTIMVYVVSREPIKTLYNYPPKIQERVKSLDEYKEKIPSTENKVGAKIIASILFLIIICIVLRYINGYTTFIESFKYGFPVVNNDVIGFRRVMISKNGYRSQFVGFRPVVTLGPNVKITPSETASSEDGTPHEITAYK